MLKKTVLLLILFSFHYVNAQITLNYNIGNTLIETDMPSCEDDESWARIFKLSDFGVGPNEQLIIRSGQIGLIKSSSGADLSFGVFSFTDFEPQGSNVLRPTKLLGSRRIGPAPVINGAPEILQANFDEPIVVPAGVDRILVSVWKSEDFYNPESAEIIIAGTEKDTADSWYNGCDVVYTWTTTTNLPAPVENANFYINVTGEIVDAKSTGSTTRLTHNICDNIIETDIYSCKDSNIYWAREFTLEDFGISQNEAFTINSGQVGVDKTGWTANLTFNIYKIDDDFPNSFSEEDLIGSSQTERLNPTIGRNPEVIQIDFETPVIVPPGIGRILVEVHKGISSGRGVAFIAGSTQDDGVSWQRNCTRSYGDSDDNGMYVSTADFGFPNANFYINVTGKVKHTSNNFAMNISNICSEFLKEFSIENKTDVAGVKWDFGDIASGAANKSTDLSPFHDFSEDGTYTITATVTAKNGTVELLTETIDVKEPPKAYGINNIYACEDGFNTGFSTSFDLTEIEQQVLAGQADKIVTYIDGSGNAYDRLPNFFKNTIRDRETISVRVAHENNSCCYSETTFDLIINPLPAVNTIPDLVTCDEDTDGFALFDISTLESDLIGSQPNLQLKLFHQNGEPVPTPLPATIRNQTANQEIITARVTNTTTNCAREISFKLNVGKSPTTYPLELIGCDDNSDGISEYFDTAQIEALITGNQAGLKLTYFDASGNQLPNPLPNPYTNTSANTEIITVRVTNAQTGCSAQTTLKLITSSQPQINTPIPLFACDEGNGKANFNTTNIEKELIGDQSGLTISYFDKNGTALPSPLPSNFQNTTAWSQHIKVRVENATNPLCYTETGFDLIVNPKPQIEIEEIYTICNLEPSLELNYSEKFDSWEWKNEDGNILSTNSHILIEQEGKYMLTIGKLKSGIECTNSYAFELKRSEPPTIEQVAFADWSNNNYIEIRASGDGDFEYSIDGINYQNSNVFEFISGGVYEATVRDKKGCGTDTKQVALVDYKKVFTPNGDGYNDHWQIKGIEAYPNAKIRIYDRYGKFLKQIAARSTGWDGTSKNGRMPSDDYWFHVDLGEGRIYKNHFTLKR